MGGGRRRAGGLAAVAGLVAACTGGRTDGGGPTSGSVPPTTAPERPPQAFYAVPDPLPPGPPGALIRALPIAGPSVLPDSHAWAIPYHSRDFDGRVEVLDVGTEMVAGKQHQLLRLAGLLVGLQRQVGQGEVVAGGHDISSGVG
jgi:hypothetical protein